MPASDKTPPSRSKPVRKTGPARGTQVRPATEGWTQQKDAEGRPLLQFASPKRGKPPVHLADLTPAERVEKVKELGLPGFRAKQLSTHYFTHYTSDPAHMTDLPAAQRDELVAGMLPPLMTEVKRLETDKGDTIKFLWRLHDGALVESVLMRYPGRITLCVSSQAGCGMNCPFCATGQAGLTRNMSTAEIIEQIVRANRAIVDGELGGKKANDHSMERVSNIVFMGMGEPLYNTDNVVAAISVLSDNEGLGLSRRRITVSTSGVVPQMERLGAEANTMLAISLHAVRDDLRDVLVPINRKYDIKQLLDACRAYPGLSNARRITFEYVMLKGVNDSDADARELVRLLKGIPAKINLIPFNPWPGSKYECSDWERIERFSEIVFRAGYASPVRTPRGRDILAACGQLKSETEKLRARARLMAEQGIGAEGVYAVGNGE